MSTGVAVNHFRAGPVGQRSVSVNTSASKHKYRLVAQLGMGAVILLVFPVLYSDNSLDAVYLTLAALAALCAPCGLVSAGK